MEKLFGIVVRNNFLQRRFFARARSLAALSDLV
jgi:hypothetical protein